MVNEHDHTKALHLGAIAPGQHDAEVEQIEQHRRQFDLFAAALVIGIPALIMVLVLIAIALLFALPATSVVPK